MTTSNAAAPAATKAPTKMDIATAIYGEIHTAGYKLADDVKGPRGEFIRRAIAEAGLTKSGAGTYYQSLKNVADGKKKYYTAKKAEKVLKETTDQANNSQVKSEGEVGAHRWMVVNAEGTELASYATKAAAKAEAKTLAGEVADRKAAEQPAA